MDVHEVEAALKVSPMPKEIAAVIWKKKTGGDYAQKALEAVKNGNNR